MVKPVGKITIQVNREVLEKLKKSCTGIYVGYRNNGESYNNGRIVAEVAAINEFGFGHNPPRPFMRKTFEENKDKYIEKTRKELRFKDVSSAEQEFKRFLTDLGEQAKKDIASTIYEWDISDPRPNAPSTVAMKERKGAKDPNAVLIDSGKMVESMEWWFKEQ